MPLEENQDQELGWAPKRYPTYRPYEQGEWRPVLENDEPIGFVWTNGGEGAGIKWIKQTDTAVDIHKVFLEGAFGGAPASTIFGVVESKFESSLGASEFGDLGAADEFLNSLDED